MHKVVTLNVPRLHKKAADAPKQSKNPELAVLTDAIKHTIYNAYKDANGTYYIQSDKKRFDIDNPAILADKIIFRVDKLNITIAYSLAPVYNGASLFDTGVEARTAAVLFFYENNQTSSKFRIIKSDNGKYKFTSIIDDKQEYFEISNNTLYRRPSGEVIHANIANAVNKAKNSSSLIDKNVLIVMLAGIDTDTAATAYNPTNPGAYKGFFANLIAYLKPQLESMGHKPVFNVVYPYGIGTGDINTVAQMMAVLKDIGNMYTSVQVNETVSSIKKFYDKESRVILIGHSGGGVAGYRVLEIIGNESIIPVKQLIMVGSPKFNIKSYVSKTTAIYDPRDFVSKYVGADFEYYDWIDDLIYYKPGRTIDDVNLVLNKDRYEWLGGHMDYFDQSNYKNIGSRILQVIANAI